MLVQFKQAPVPQTAPATVTPEKVEVVWTNGADVPQISLQYSTWVEGLGWCPQKTLPVPLEQLDDLHRALTVARLRAKRCQADKGEVSTPAKVIRLPFA